MIGTNVFMPELYWESYKFDVKYSPNRTAKIDIQAAYVFSDDQWIEAKVGPLFESGVIDEAEDSLIRQAESKYRQLESYDVFNNASPDDTFLVVESLDDVLEFDRIEGVIGLQDRINDMETSLGTVGVVEADEFPHSVGHDNTLVVYNITRAFHNNEI